MTYDFSVVDLVKAYQRALARGPEAASAFRAALNAAAARYLRMDESMEEAFFSIIYGDETSGRGNA